jgi:hypothetical protein
MSERMSDEDFRACLANLDWDQQVPTELINEARRARESEAQLLEVLRRLLEATDSLGP